MMMMDVRGLQVLTECGQVKLRSGHGATHSLPPGWTMMMMMMRDPMFFFFVILVDIVIIRMQQEHERSSDAGGHTTDGRTAAVRDRNPGREKTGTQKRIGVL